VQSSPALNPDIAWAIMLGLLLLFLLTHWGDLDER
jgi:hypothetical protein